MRTFSWILVFFAIFCGDLQASSYNSFDTNPYLTTEMRERMLPFLLPPDQPIKKPLDAIFKNYRASNDKHSLKSAGFKILFQQKRSFICVVSHPDLPGYLLKLYTDDELRQKHDKPGWQYLARRCEGARKIRNVIKRYGIIHFQVPQKWLYPLPPWPYPTSTKHQTRHPAVLVVEDMDLVPEKENLKAWKTNITKSHLDELFLIISRAKGSSYRPDNIHYSKNGKFSFIDTEYPNRAGDYKSIRPYLSKEMGRYWDQLVHQAEFK